MKMGILGLPQVGKKTLFHLLSGAKVQPSAISRGKAPSGVARLRDSRLDQLTDLYHPKKTTPALLEILLAPSLEAGEYKHFDLLESVDLVCHVVRAFENDQVFHLQGSVDPCRDLEKAQSELNLWDWMFVEKRLERIEKDRGRRKIRAGEEELLKGFQAHLEAQKPLLTYPLKESHQELIASYPLLTLKKQLVVLNVGEEKLDPSLWKDLQSRFEDQNLEWVILSARLEEELEELDEEEQREYLQEFSIEERALEKLGLACFRALDLLTFFTVGADEVRGWTIPKGSSAPRAARAIHSDLERGFIRAEVMKYPDLMEHGSEKKLRELGKFYTKGKDYLVEEGDILHILFNV